MLEFTDFPPDFTRKQNITIGWKYCKKINMIRRVEDYILVKSLGESFANLVKIKKTDGIDEL